MEKSSKELDSLLNKEYLIEEYINKKVPYSKIAKIIGCDSNTVKKRLLKYNISLRNISEVMKNRPEETKLAMSKSHVGKVSPFKGHKHTEETKQKISKIHKGKIISDKHKQKISSALKGRKSPNYIDGRTPLVTAIYNLSNYDIWRNKIFKRDNYICRKCLKQGGKLEAHHIKKFHLILEEFLKIESKLVHFNLDISKDREILIRLASIYSPFWDIKNGETLCKRCHSLKHGDKTKCSM